MQKRAISDHFSKIDKKFKTSGLSRSEEKTGQDSVNAYGEQTSLTVLDNSSHKMEQWDVYSVADVSENEMDSYISGDAINSPANYWENSGGIDIIHMTGPCEISTRVTDGPAQLTLTTFRTRKIRYISTSYRDTNISPGWSTVSELTRPFLPHVECSAQLQ